MANLKDVAHKAGVSVATASLALNGKQVNEKTRTRVLKYARELNYVPNRGGRTLITGKSNTILMVIINSTKYPNLIEKSTFFYHFMQEILNVANEHDYNFHLAVINWEDSDLPNFFQKKVNDKSNDGMIIIPQYRRDYSFLPFIKDFPSVILNPWQDCNGIASINVDHNLGGTLVANEFITNGYRKIAVIHGPDDHHDGYCRKVAFLERLTSFGFSIPLDFQYESDFTTQSGYLGAKQILSSGTIPEALFCANDYVAAGAAHYFHEHGIRVPEDVALIGYDNTDIAETLHPQLTTVGGILKEVGHALGNLLFEVIKQPNSTLTRSHEILPQLVKRESCPIKMI
ncbi:LacI family DNA-binding transcriptional regulator [Pleomorphochaeta sp. DL1XJH-081]|uniref:LacI family DNA-binding transcriptional regulator n=1 Tax=Pleomorphochaeta sp. DL1XJH-081 TaxID=3409690 RepID=UPI003BB53790